jgi:dynactin complex subunit
MAFICDAVKSNGSPCTHKAKYDANTKCGYHRSYGEEPKSMEQRIDELELCNGLLQEEINELRNDITLLQAIFNSLKTIRYL